MNIILSIDPGSRVTGYGIIKSDGNKHTYIGSGCVRTTSENFPMRLQQIFNGIKEVIGTYAPQESAIEDVFMHTNPRAALKLGQARGAAISALVAHDLQVAEYSARAVKQAVVGYGAATKNQVQDMVKSLLNVTGDIQEDAADALAIAICHAHTKKLGALI